jgi:ABC-type polysaccharide/polyol phosphate export permease
MQATGILYSISGRIFVAEGIPVYDSGIKRSKAVEEFVEAYRYRHLIAQLIRRDVLTRYKRSALGVAWTMLNPLGMMLVLTIAFSQLFGGTRAYPAYVLSGLIAWNFFSQTTTAGMNQMVWGGGLLSRIYIPRTVFVLSSIGTGIVNLLLSMVPLIIVLLITGTPIQSIIPESLRVWLFTLNPMYHLLALFRAPLYEGVLPPLVDIAPGVGIGFLVLTIGWFVFSQRSDEFAYRV